MNKRIKKKHQKNNQSNEITLQQAVDKVIDEMKKGGHNCLFVDSEKVENGRLVYCIHDAYNKFKVIGSKSYEL